MDRNIFPSIITIRSLISIISKYRFKMISNVVNKKSLNFLSEKIEELAKGMFTIKEIYNSMENQNFELLYKEENGIFKGICYFEVINLCGQNVIHLWITWIDKSEKTFGNDILKNMIYFGKRYNAKKIITSTQNRMNRVRAMFRKYGFKVNSITLVKEI